MNIFIQYIKRTNHLTNVRKGAASALSQFLQFFPGQFIGQLIAAETEGETLGAATNLDKSIAAHLWELDAFVSADGCDWKVSY